MYKLMIVDDDELAREMIGVTLDWNSLGFELFASFPDGRDAIEFLKKNKIDVILTDIKMRFVSGIELAKTVQELYPETMIVLLSAYSEFDLARQAIKYNVIDYILKPVTYTTLYKTFEMIRSKLNVSLQYITFIDNETSLQRQHIISNIFSHDSIEYEKIKESFTRLNIQASIETSPTAMVQFHINDFQKFLINIWKYEKERLYSVINKLFHRDYPSAYFIPYQTSFDDISVFVISKNADETFEDHINIYLKDIVSELNNGISLSSIYKITARASNFIELIDFITPTTQNIKMRYLLSCIHAGNKNDALSTLESLIAANDHIDGLKKLAHYIAASLQNVLYIPLKDKPNFTKQNIDSLNTPLTLQNAIKNMVFLSLNMTKDNYTTETDKILSRAIEYIDSHFALDITQEDVAFYVAFSTSYFSQFFKTYKKEKFIDYLTSVRINKAKELLETTSCKIYEISTMVGYKKYDHFSKLFKRNTGLTPELYRKDFIRSSEWDEK